MPGCGKQPAPGAEIFVPRPTGSAEAAEGDRLGLQTSGASDRNG